jgi:hypothetical protein
MVSRPAATHYARYSTAIAITFACAVVALGTAALLLHHYWPFTEAKVRQELVSSLGAGVHFGSFRETYFPPGCIAENVTFYRSASGIPLISVRKLSIRGTLTGLFRHHVSVVRADGMHVVLGREDFTRTGASGNNTVIDRLMADGGVLELKQGGGRRPMRFVFHRFRLQNLGGSGTMQFAAVLDNPMPAGVIYTSGEFGPWNAGRPSATPVSGHYSLENADLSVFRSIAGHIWSTGKFHGTANQILVEGSTTTPELEVTNTQHQLPLKAQFSAMVNAITGEITLQNVKGIFGRDEIQARGSFGRHAGGQRSAIVDLSCQRGRVEDTFYPFIHKPRAPLTGNVVFQMHVVIPSGSEAFLQKIELTSDFHILNAEFSDPGTESRVRKVSEAPHEKEPPATSAHLQGRVAVNNGVAHFVFLQVEDGAAKADLHGSYNLASERVDMHGRLATEASLTKTTSGIRAVFARALEPLLKKRHHQTIVPVKISGTFQHPDFGLDIGGSM